MSLKALAQKVFLWEIVQGMALTFGHLFKPTVTIQYPWVKKPLPPNYRGLLSLLRYDDGTEKCVGCGLCEATCPSRCIKVVSNEVPGQPLKRFSSEFYIDITRCVFCGNCVDACPVTALAMTREYEHAVYDKRELLFDKKKLLALGDEHFPDREKRMDPEKNLLHVFNLGSRQYPPKKAAS